MSPPPSKLACNQSRFSAINRFAATSSIETNHHYYTPTGQDISGRDYAH